MSKGTQDRSRVSDSQASFSGGLNSTASEFNVGDTQVKLAENVVLTQYGDATRRGGSQRMSTAAIAAAPVRGGFCWRTAATHEYLTACNGRLYSGGTYAIPMAWTDKGAITSASAYPSFEAFRDGAGECVYLADGTFRKYTGGVLSAPGGTPALTQVAAYNQRLYGITGADQTIHYSALNNGDTCGVVSATSGNAVVRTFGNQKLTALLALNGALAMFHVSGVSRFVGLTQDDLYIGAGSEGLSTDTGTVAPRSPISVEGYGYFLSERGAFRITDQGVEALDAPDSPDPTVPILPGLSASAFAQIDAVHDKNGRTIRWYLPDVGVYVYHYRLNAWSGPHTGAYISPTTHCLFDGIDASGRPAVFAGGADGHLRQLEMPGSFLDDVLADGSGGNRYTMTVQCRRFFTDHAESEKAWRWAYLFADLKGSMSGLVSWSTASGSGSYTIPSVITAVWGAITWGAFTWGGGGNRPFRIPLSGRGSYLDLVYSDDGTTGTLLSRVDIEAFDYGRRG